MVDYPGRKPERYEKRACESVLRIEFNSKVEENELRKQTDGKRIEKLGSDAS